jgi:hypothetical protein
MKSGNRTSNMDSRCFPRVLPVRNRGRKLGRPVTKNAAQKVAAAFSRIPHCVHNQAQGNPSSIRGFLG